MDPAPPEPLISVIAAAPSPAGSHLSAGGRAAPGQALGGAHEAGELQLVLQPRVLLLQGLPSGHGTKHKLFSFQAMLHFQMGLFISNLRAVALHSLQLSAEAWVGKWGNYIPNYIPNYSHDYSPDFPLEFLRERGTKPGKGRMGGCRGLPALQGGNPRPEAPRGLLLV